ECPVGDDRAERRATSRLRRRVVLAPHLAAYAGNLRPARARLFTNRLSLLPPPPPTLGTSGPLDPGPLRIVFLASAPIDLLQLDFEREEDAMLRATSRLGQDVIVYISDTGTFDELADLVASIRPHIVHLSGHGSVDTSGRGSFAFEDERGQVDARDAADLATQIFRGSSVRCVVLNACKTSQAAASGLCQ